VIDRKVKSDYLLNVKIFLIGFLARRIKFPCEDETDPALRRASAEKRE
jgi:hypothetical protein